MGEDTGWCREGLSELWAGWARTPSPSLRPKSLAREGGGLTCTQVGFRPETLSLSPCCTPVVLPEATCPLPSAPHCPPFTTCSDHPFSGFQGSHCEQCLPLFVGSAVGGGTCRPCHAFCRGNSHVCVSRKELEMARREPEKYSLDPEEVEEATVQNSWVSGRKGLAHASLRSPCLSLARLTTG